MEAFNQSTTLVPVTTGLRLNTIQAGVGDPLVLVMGLAASHGFWVPLLESFAEHHRVVAFDNRGIGDSERGEGRITVKSLAADALALLDALEIERAHVLGWSLGSAVAQELALAHPGRIGALVLYATWGGSDGYMRAMFAALRTPWENGDAETGLTALRLNLSPELLNSPDFESRAAKRRSLLPQTEMQIRTTAEQFRAAQDHVTLDRLHEIRAPTLVIAGTQDLLVPPWQCEAVAERIPRARYELFEGPGSSHALMLERADEFTSVVLAFLRDHPLD